MPVVIEKDATPRTCGDHVTVTAAPRGANRMKLVADWKAAGSTVNGGEVECDLWKDDGHLFSAREGWPYRRRWR